MSPSLSNVMSGARACVLAAALLSVSACTSSPLETSDLGKTRDTSRGEVLVSSAGDTLYTFNADAPDTSNCTGPCAVIWPPAVPAPNAEAKGDFTIITRDNGTRQWAYKGKPLYTYRLDGGPGAISGEGVDGNWHVAKP